MLLCCATAGCTTILFVTAAAVVVVFDGYYYSHVGRSVDRVVFDGMVVLSVPTVDGTADKLNRADKGDAASRGLW